MLISPIREKSYQFALDVIELYRSLVAQREFVIARQLLKAGTSIGANIEEARAGQSRRDFLAKMSVASKEAREARYWLRLLCDSQMVACEEIRPLMLQSEELIRMLTSIVKTTAEAEAKSRSKLKTQHSKLEF